MKSLLVLIAALAAICAPAVSAHGWIERPAARQLEACNGKGLMGAVYKSGGAGTGDKAVPLGGYPAMCGDPFMDKMLERWGEDHWTHFDKWECAPQETYTEGGVLDMQFIVDAHHGGFITANICDGDSSMLSEGCLKKWPLKTVEQNHERYYMLTGGEMSETKPDVYDINWRLPQGLSCDHCVLSITWWTAHHCTYDCDREICDWYADRHNFVVRPSDDLHEYPICDTLEPAFGERPQIYRNCADIRITPASGATEPAAWVRPPHDDAPDCGTWHEDSDWHSDGDLGEGTTADSRDACIADCDAYKPPAGSLPCNAVTYFTSSGGCDFKNVGQYWVINEGFEPAGERSGWQRCEGGQTPPPATDPSTDNTPASPAPTEELADEPEEEPAAEPTTTEATPEQPAAVVNPFVEEPTTVPAPAPAPAPTPAPTLPAPTKLPPPPPSTPAATPVSEEEEIEETVSGAGDMMHCDNERVVQLLGELNERRSNKNNEPLTCDDKATGVAVNWSELMCDGGELANDEADNCHLAFERECMEVVNVRESLDLYALSGMEYSLKRPLYNTAELTSVGMGYFECGEEVYWTVLAASPAEAAAPTTPAPTEAPKQGGSALYNWFKWYSSTNAG